MVPTREERTWGWMVPMVCAVLVVLATVTAPISVAGSSVDDSCREINGHKYCLVAVWTDQDTVAPGESVSVHATVENRGSKMGTISTYLGIRRPDGSKSYPSGEKAYDIAVGERVQLDYTAEIPSDAPEGDYELTVDVWTGNDAQMFDTSGWRQQFSVDEPTTEATITATSAAGTYAPGEDVPIDVTVENTGDTTHEFYVDASLQRPNGNWVTGEGTTVTLDPGERDGLTLDATVPDDANEGTYSVGSGIFHSRAKDERYAYGQDRDSITVESANSDPTADRDTPSREITIKRGETVDLAIDADDSDGNLAGTEWYVDDDLVDETQWIDGDSDTARLSRTFDTAGTYTVEGTVFDAERAYSSAVEWTVTVDEPTTDAAITRTDADGTYLPGETVPVEVTVENTGETTHDFYVDASLQRLNGDWITGEDATVGLRPGERESLTLDVAVPDDAADGSYTVGAGVFRSDDKDETFGGDHERDAVVVDEPTTDAAIRSTSATGTYAPGETVPVAVTVENTGDTTHEFYVDASLQRPNGDWITGESTTVRLGSGDRRSLTLAVRVPSDAEDGRYSVGSGVFRSSAKDEKFSGENERDAVVVDEPTTDAAIRSTDADGTYTPGETVPIEVVVENTGDTTHEFYVDASLQRPNGDWVTGEDTTVGLRPGERETLSLSATVPDGASAGDYAVGAAVFRSSATDERFDGGQTLGAFTVEQANSDPVADRDAPRRERTITPGDRVEFAVDAEDSDGNLVGTEWYVDGDLVSETQRIDGSSDAATFARTFDAAGTYTVEGMVFDAERAYSAGVTWTVRVEEPTTDARIVAQSVDGEQFRPGATVPMEVVVENTGETTREFYVDASLRRPNGDWVTGEAATPRLSPGERDTLDLTVSLSDDAAEGSYGAGSAIYRSSAKTDRYDQWGAGDAFAVDEPTTNAAITSIDASGTSLPGETVPVEVTVENTGETTHEFYVDASLQRPSGDWVTGEDTTVELQPGARTTVTLDVVVPDDAVGGSYTVGAGVFQSSAKDDSLGGADERDAFTVADLTADATITATDAPSETYAPGADAPVAVTVENTGDVRETFFVTYAAVGPDDDSAADDRTGTTVTLTPGESDTVRLTHSVEADAQAGTYADRIAVWNDTAPDASDTPLDRVERDAAFTVDRAAIEATVPDDPFKPFYSLAQTPTASLTITNPGTTARTVTLVPETVVDGARVDAGQSREVRLEPDETRTVAVDWDLSEASVGAATPLSVRIDSPQGQHRVVAGETLIATTLVETTVSLSHWETGDAITDATVRGVLQTGTGLPTGFDSQTFTAEHVGDGQYSFGKLPKGASLDLVAKKDGFSTLDWMIVVGDTRPITGHRTFSLQPMVDVQIEFVREETGEPIADLPVTVQDRTYETNRRGVVRLPKQPAGSTLDVTVDGYENDKPYRLTREVTVDSDGQMAVRASKLKELGSETATPSLPQERSLELTRKFIAGPDPDISTTAAIEESLDDLVEADASGRKLLFVRSREGLVAVVADLDEWQRTPSTAAYETVPIGDQIVSPAPGAPVVMTDEMEQEMHAGVGYAVSGAAEGGMTGLSGTDETYEFLGSSQGVYLDRDSGSYKVGHFIGKLLTESVGMTARGIHERDGDKATKGTALLVFDLFGGKILKGAGKSVSAASKTVKNARVYRWAKGAVGLAKPTATRLDSFAAYSGSLRETILSRSPSYLGRVLKSSDESSSLTTREKFDIVDDYYANRGAGTTADAAQKIRTYGDEGVDHETIVRAAEDGVDLRYGPKLVEEYGVSETTVRALLKQRVALSKAVVLLDETAMTASDLSTVAAKMNHPRNAFNSVDWRQFFADAYELRTVENFDQFFKTGDDSVMHTVETAQYGSQLKGDMAELATAREIGADNVKRLGDEVKLSQSEVSAKASDDIVTDGVFEAEIDIVRTDGTLVEVKNSLSATSSSKLATQVERYKEYARHQDGLSPTNVEIRLRSVDDEQAFAELLDALPNDVTVRRLDSAASDGATRPSLSPVTPEVGTKIATSQTPQTVGDGPAPPAPATGVSRGVGGA